MPSKTLNKFCNKKVADLKLKGRYRSLTETNRANHCLIERDGRNLVSFGCNDYLGLSHNSQVIKASQSATKKYGSGSLSSRLITGNNYLYDQLESQLSELYNIESTAIYSSGYSANLGVISLLVKNGDLVICDKLSHNCIINGAKLSGAKLVRYKHNDYQDLSRILEESRGQYNNCLIITESVFSMDGDITDVGKLKQISKSNDAWLMVDYAHDIKTYSKKLSEKVDMPDIITGTLSKSLASIGGFVGASSNLIELIKSSSDPLIYSTALPPAALASASKALEIASSNENRAKGALKNAEYLIKVVKGAIISKYTEHLDETNFSQIIPIIIGDSMIASDISQKLSEKGFYVPAIKAPTVPENKARLRFSISYTHTRKQIDEVINCLSEIIN